MARTQSGAAGSGKASGGGVMPKGGWRCAAGRSRHACIMCVHASFTEKARLKIAREQLAEDMARDIAPPDEVRAWDVEARMPVISTVAGIRTSVPMRWGWCVPWQRALMVNTRDDSLFSKSVWKGAASHRCAVAADAFFEWAGPVGAKWEVKFARPGGEPFFFAGVWRQEGEVACWSMMTTRPNALLEALPHDRMPVLLDLAQAKGWIGEHELPKTDVLAFCQPFAGELIRADQPKPPPRAKLKKSDSGSGEFTLTNE